MGGENLKINRTETKSSSYRAPQLDGQYLMVVVLMMMVVMMMVMMTGNAQNRFQHVRIHLHIGARPHSLETLFTLLLEEQKQEVQKRSGGVKRTTLTGRQSFNKDVSY